MRLLDRIGVGLDLSRGAAVFSKSIPTHPELLCTCRRLGTGSYVATLVDKHEWCIAPIARNLERMIGSNDCAIYQ